RDYHRRQAEALAKNEAPAVLVNNAGLTKRVIERALSIVLVAAKDAANYPGMALDAAVPAAVKPKGSEALASWEVLTEDTRLNETVRRRQIHEVLAAGPVRPDQIVKRVYKEVLHTDLDDPYLGLGEVLLANYPFAKEDKIR